MTLKSLLLAGLATLTSCESSLGYLKEIASRSPSMTLTGDKLEGEMYVENIAIGDASDYYLLDNREFEYVSFKGDNITLFFKEFYSPFDKDEVSRVHHLIEVPLELARTKNVPVKAVFDGCFVRSNLTEGSYRLKDCQYFSFEPKLKSE